MRSFASQTLADQLAADGVVTADEALELRKIVFPDGVVGRDEAEMFVAIAARVANTDEEWTNAFVEAISDHVLSSSAFPGHVDEEAAAWVVANFGKAGVRETEVLALLKVLERAESAPESLSEFTRQCVAELLAGKAVGESEVEFVRRCLYASAGSGRTSVTDVEARWLFALDSESDGRANAAAWGDLFVKAVLCHLMGRRAPAMLEANAMMARQAWLSAPTQGVGALLSGMFKGARLNLNGDMDGDTPAERWEAHYDAVNDEAAADAKLTLNEIAWAVGMTRADQKLTVNERALLAEIRKLEAEGVA